MRKALILALFLTIPALAQSKPCEQSVVSRYDKVAGKTIRTGQQIDLNDILINTFHFDNRGPSITFTVSPSCVGDDAKILLLFRDGSRLTVFANSKFNCDGRVAIYFGDVFRNDDLLQTLKTKPLETIRIYTYKSSIDEDFTKEQSALLMSELTCLDQ